jgi:hypothetical protein
MQTQLILKMNLVQSPYNSHKKQENTTLRLFCDLQASKVVNPKPLSGAFQKIGLASLDRISIDPP